MHLAPTIQSNSRRLPIYSQPNSAGSGDYGFLIKNPSCAGFLHGGLDVVIFKVATSSTKAEIEFNQQTRNYELIHRISLWRKNLSDASTDASVDSISATVDSLLEAVDYNGISSINLINFNYDVVNAEHLVAVLRTTFSLRDQVLGWRRALAAAPAVLRRQGFDPEEELFGLDSEP